MVSVICKDNVESPKSSNFVQRLVGEQRCLADVVIFKGVRQVRGISILIGADQMSKIIKNEIKSLDKCVPRYREHLVGLDITRTRFCKVFCSHESRK